MMNNSLFQLTQAAKTDKKAVKRFFKQQKFSAKFIGLDNCYYIKSANDIVAAVIISQIKPNLNQLLLHGLVVDKEFRRQGSASRLLTYLKQKYQLLICFADKGLTSFYQNNGFHPIGISEINNELSGRYKQYHSKNNKLLIFKYALVRSITKASKDRLS